MSRAIYAEIIRCHPLPKLLGRYAYEYHISGFVQQRRYARLHS